MLTAKSKTTVVAFALAWLSAAGATAQEFKLRVTSPGSDLPTERWAGIDLRVTAASGAALGRAQVELHPQRPFRWPDGEPAAGAQRFGTTKWFFTPERQVEKLLITTAGYESVDSMPGQTKDVIPPGNWTLAVLSYVGYGTSLSFDFRLAAGDILTGDVVLRELAMSPPPPPPPPPPPKRER